MTVAEIKFELQKQKEQRIEFALNDDLKKSNTELKKYINELSIAKQSYILAYASSEDIANKYKQLASELGLDPLKNADYSSIKSLLANKIK
jgi:hypothetical protein